MAVLPREIDYSQKLATLPSNTSCLSAVVAPANGSTFSTDSALIYFDLPSRGFMVPSSLYLRYKVTAVAGTTIPIIKGIPFSTFFSKSEVLIGSQIVESIQQYGQLYNIMVNTKLNHATKTSMAYGFGLIDNATVPTYSNLNGRTLAASSTQYFTMAAPLGNILSNCDHLVPLGMMPSVRIQLTTEALSTILFQGSATTTFSLSNLELCMDIIEFGDDVNRIVASMADTEGNIFLKSQSFSSSSQYLASASSGQVELVFNQRLSSIKSVIANFGKATLNTIYDSVDVTSSTQSGSTGGDYQFVIAGQTFPPRPISTVTGKAGAFMELMNCWGPAHSIETNNMSITPAEFSYISAGTTTGLIPGKFYVGCNVEKLSTNNALLTGQSSMLSPISLRINIGSTATGEVHTVTLICCYDAILSINVITRQASVKQ